MSFLFNTFQFKIQWNFGSKIHHTENVYSLCIVDDLHGWCDEVK